MGRAELSQREKEMMAGCKPPLRLCLYGIRELEFWLAVIGRSALTPEAEIR